MTAGAAVVEALRAEGVDYMFGICGSTTNNILTELHGRSDLKFIDTRHEQNAALMAHGYARASAKPAVCLTTSGPATINLLSGIALAYKGRAPVVVIAGDVSTDHLDRDGNQSFDLVSLFKPVTFMARHVHKTERVIEAIHDAFRTAMSGKRGPVMLNIPRDLLDHTTIDYAPAAPGAYRATAQRTRGDDGAVREAAALLAAAERPVLMAGSGVIDSEATAEAVKLAEALGMALVPAYGHNDTVPNSHPLYVGIPGGRGAPEAAEAIHRADVLLALGSRLSQSSTGWDNGIINPATRIVQIDIDAAEVGRNFPVKVGIVGDAKAVALQLLEALPGGERRTNTAWRTEIAALKEKRQARLRKESELTGDPMMPQRVFPELRKVMPRDCMVTIDAGTCPGLAYDRLDFESPRTLHNYFGHGALGMGLPVGIGTKIGRPDRPALVLHGDGGFLYAATEINTAVRHRIPHVTVVLNNSCHGSEKAQQMRQWKERYVGVDLENPRFDKLGEVLGARGFYVTRPDEIADAVKTAFAHDGPAVVEIPVAQHFPPRAATPGKSKGGH
ncbi:MAG TPA: thiamine pyrophosphate-binding protein [Burkholderiales bacterium]|nr:thiamine pyrophosphate-binding protein [Burkholderiales bacterium]